MAWPAAFLAIGAMAAMFLSMAATYVAAPKLRAYMKRRTPPVDVPLFDFGDQCGTRRLFRLIWSMPIPQDHKNLRALLIATRAFYVAAPLLMVSALIVMASFPSRETEASRAGLPPPFTVKLGAEEKPGG